MDNYQMFKVAFRGFDKNEVLAYIQRQDDANNEHAAALEKEIRKRDKVISELKTRIILKDSEVEKLKKDIEEKYQKYIDNYELISKLVYESRVKSDKLIEESEAEAKRTRDDANAEAAKTRESASSDAEKKLADAEAAAGKKVEDAEAKAKETLADANARADKTVAEANARAGKAIADAHEKAGKTIADADAEASKTLKDAGEQSEKIISDAKTKAEQQISSAQDEINAQLTDGRSKYKTVQAELERIVEMFNEIQKQFILSYKEVHRIAASMPTSLDDAVSAAPGLPDSGRSGDGYIFSGDAGDDFYDDDYDDDDYDDGSAKAIDITHRGGNAGTGT